LPDTVKITIPKVLRNVRIAGGACLEPQPANATEQAGADSVGFSCLDTFKQQAFSEGYEQGVQEWSARFSQALMALENEATRLAEAKLDFMNSIHEGAVELALTIADKFLISEKEKKNYSITAIVNSVLEKIDHKGGRLTIALNPEDVEALGDCSDFVLTTRYPR